MEDVPFGFCLVRNTHNFTLFYQVDISVESIISIGNPTDLDALGGGVGHVRLQRGEVLRVVGLQVELAAEAVQQHLEAHLRQLVHDLKESKATNFWHAFRFYLKLRKFREVYPDFK